MIKFDILYYELKKYNVNIENYLILIKYFFWDILFLLTYIVV